MTGQNKMKGFSETGLRKNSRRASTSCRFGEGSRSRRPSQSEREDTRRRDRHDAS
jgi:hypothetical protein